MATVILQGGLGNQLFQYACARSLSHKNKSNLYLDPSRISRDPSPDTSLRNYHLPKFRTKGIVTSKPTLEDTTTRTRFRLFSLLSYLSPETAARICRVHKDQSPLQFCPYVLKLPRNSTLFGYYQSEEYFRSIAEELRDELVLKEDPSTQNRKWKEKIGRQNSVGVHVRRGDYTSKGWELPVEYYRSAIKKITSLVDDAAIFFFSDNIEWVRSNVQRVTPPDLPERAVEYVECNDIHEATEDLRLMRSCRHNIISNSSFSWWGAWLNQNEKKIVLAPNYWIYDYVDNLGIIPSRWHTIEI